jgi:hypothetical protein
LRVLSAGAATTSVLLAVGAVLVVAAAASSADPPSETDHGLADEQFCRLWAGDADATNESTATPAENDAPAVCALAERTDVPLDEPPRAVERWNRGELTEFTTNRSRSVHPPHADLEDGRYLKDVHATVFAVQPSTVAHIASGDRPHYVAPEGNLLGVVDYRVRVPDDQIGEYRRVYWGVGNHSVVRTELLVDGAVVETGDGSPTPTLGYTLDGQAGDRHTLTLRATVAVNLSKRVYTCTALNNRSQCTAWNRTVYYRTDRLTVTDSVTVTAYDLQISGFRTRYPNGDLGLVLFKNQPWLGYELGDESRVRGVWRFYGARDDRWDTMRVRTADGTSTRPSKLHPLQVHAYPFEPGPTAAPRRTVDLLATYGDRTAAPTLPEDVQLDAVDGPYTASYGIAVRVRTDRDVDSITAQGLVSGVTIDGGDATFGTIPMNRTNLSMTVLNASDDTATVRVTLRDAETGAPVATADRPGHLVVAGERLNTTANGTVTTTVPTTNGAVAARYEPGPWWRTSPGYVGDSAVARTSGPVLRGLAVLSRFGVPVGLVLLATYLLDRVTGWGIWPLWRGL